MCVPLFEVQRRLSCDFDMLKMASLDNLRCFALRFSSKNSSWGSSDEMQWKQNFKQLLNFIHSGLGSD